MKNIGILKKYTDIAGYFVKIIGIKKIYIRYLENN